MTHPPDPLAKKVFDRIEQGGLAPRPRWEFVLKQYFFWMLGAVAVALGAFAFSAALFEVQNAGWRFYSVTHGDFLSFFLSVAPFLWVAALVLFIALGYYNIRATRRGYRYPLAVIALGAVLTSIALGTGLYAAGLGAELEESLGDHPPFYRPILTQEHSFWVDPQGGRLAGTVVSLGSTTDSFVLKDFDGTLWSVSASDLRGPDIVALARGGTVRVVGIPQTASSSVFHACFLFPWAVAGLPSGALPPPIYVPDTGPEISSTTPRSQECRGIRPYARLRTIDGDGF